MIGEDINILTSKIIGTAIEVHRELGPGLLEPIYEQCLFYELQQKQLVAETQKEIPLVYKNTNLARKLRLDLVIENKVILEIKSVERLIPIHEAQLLSYLKLSNYKVGLLINFNEIKLVDGIRRLDLET